MDRLRPFVEENNRATELHVMKFGGTSVGKVDGIHSIGDIVESERFGQVLVVVSAINGTTDALFNIVEKIKGRQSREVRDIFMATMIKHFDIAQNLMMSTHSTDVAMSQIAKIGLGLEYEVFDEEKESANKLDRIVSYGEALSTALISSYLQYRGIPACIVDAANIVRTTSDFGHARPLWDETGKNAKEHLAPRLKNGFVPVVTGFCGSDGWGEKTILERGGSDVTASVLARVLGASKLTFFKEVDGVYDKNPSLFPDAIRYSQLTLEQADVIASEGNKVLAPGSMEPLLGSNINVEVRSTFSPFEMGTIISS